MAAESIHLLYQQFQAVLYFKGEFFSVSFRKNSGLSITVCPGLVPDRVSKKFIC